jgi:hypothetical protein
MKTDPKNQKRVQGSRLHPEQASPNNNPTKQVQETRFTPAPWAVVQDRLVYAGNKYIVDCEFGGLPSNDPAVAEQRANAQLIAAAPELYEACRMSDEATTQRQLDAACEAIRAALAKAREEAVNE